MRRPGRGGGGGAAGYWARPQAWARAAAPVRACTPACHPARPRAPIPPATPAVGWAMACPDHGGRAEGPIGTGSRPSLRPRRRRARRSRPRGQAVGWGGGEPAPLLPLFPARALSFSYPLPTVPPPPVPHVLSCGGDASPTLTHVRRRRSLDSTDRPPTPRDDASPRPPSGDVEAANPAFGFFGPAEADGGRARMRTSPSRGGGPSPGARPFSAPSQDGGAGPKPVGGGGGGGGSPPAKAAPAQASRRSWAGFAVALLLALALLVGVGVDRAVHTPRPSCAVEVGLRAWGKPGQCFVSGWWRGPECEQAVHGPACSVP